MKIKSRLLQEMKLRSKRGREGRDGVRSVIKPGSNADLANYMKQHSNDKFR